MAERADIKEIDGVVHVRRKVLKITETWEPQKDSRCKCEDEDSGDWDGPHKHCGKHAVCCHCGCDHPPQT